MLELKCTAGLGRPCVPARDARRHRTPDVGTRTVGLQEERLDRSDWLVPFLWPPQMALDTSRGVTF